MFTKSQMPKGKYVHDDLSFECTEDGITYTATIYRDDNNERPDKNDEGYWPSKNPNDHGYIGKRARPSFKVQYAQAEMRMKLWENGEWEFYGIAITASKCGVELVGKYDHACWGIEGNWPRWRGMPLPLPNDNTLPCDNSYFIGVANNLLAEAEEAAKAKLKELAQ